MHIGGLNTDLLSVYAVLFEVEQTFADELRVHE